MNYCSKCLYPSNHPFGIVFNDNNVCSGCLLHEEKDKINWIEKKNKLKKIVKSYKDRYHNTYDCIVPISGGKDSYFIVDQVKKLGLNPLLVSYNYHYNTYTGFQNIAYLKTITNFDHIQLNLHPKKIKKITKYTLRNFGSIYWHIQAGKTVFPVQIAVKFHIPLIIWGAHQGIDQVGMFSHHEEVEMTRKYRKEHDLLGYEGEDLLSQKNHNLNEDDLSPFFYPDDIEIAKNGIKGIYLNNYIRWDTKEQHERMIKKYNYKTCNQLRTFDNYNDVHCNHYSGLHDYIKYLKLGYGCITDHVTREIRLKRITRNQGIDFIKKYSNIFPKDIEIFSKWININVKEILDIIEKFRNKDVWNKNKNGKWVLKNKLKKNYNKNTHLQKKNINTFKFITNNSIISKEKNRNFLLNKGF